MAENGTIGSTRSPSVAADVADQRLDLARLGAVDLVEDAEHALAGRVRERERLALGRLGGLPDGEDPDDGVGVAQEVARHPLVLGADRVQPGRVDDLDAPERLEREEDLDQAHVARVGVAQRGAETQRCPRAAIARVVPSWYTTRASGVAP